MPLVTFLLPTHNRADVLGYAIASVLAQTIHDFELLIVGDGCTDDTEQVVERFQDPRISWLPFEKGPNLGYGHRNTAFRQARGELIAFMAHDDLICHDHLALLLPHFEDHTIDIVHSRPVWIDPHGMLIPSTFSLRNSEQLEFFLNRRFNSIPASCFIHRRSCFERVGYWNDSLPNCGDWDYWARIIEHGGRRNFAVEYRATCLHFRANWRTGTNVAPQEIDAWRSWPVERGEAFLDLERDSVIEEPEQARYWRAMQSDPKRWADMLRDEIAARIDSRVSLADALFRRLEAKGLLQECCSLAYARELEAECARKDAWILELESQCLAKERWNEKLQRDIDELKAAINSATLKGHRE